MLNAEYAEIVASGVEHILNSKENAFQEDGLEHFRWFDRHAYLPNALLVVLRLLTLQGTQEV